VRGGAAPQFYCLLLVLRQLPIRVELRASNKQ